MRSHHNGTVGSNRKFDEWSSAQDKQHTAERRDDAKERFDEPRAEGDRLAEVASDLRAESERIGAMCFSLLRCRERATEYGYSDVVLAVQPLVDLYQDKLKVAKDAFVAADCESKSFDVRMVQ